jgi:hypothetical protein
MRGILLALALALSVSSTALAQPDSAAAPEPSSRARSAASYLVDLAGDEPDARRRDVGGSGGARSDPRHQESTLRGEPDRFGDLRADRLVVCRRGPDCELHPGAARDEGRSASGSSTRIVFRFSGINMTGYFRLLAAKFEDCSELKGFGSAR